MSKINLQMLMDVSQSYSGEGISVRTLEETIHHERGIQRGHVDRLNAMRERNGELQQALTQEVDKLRQITESLEQERRRKQSGASVWQNMLAKLPFMKERQLTRQSIEELLRRQYEISALRVKEAAEFSDRLSAAKEDLYDEIERLNQKIIDYAHNERAAAANVIQLSELKTELEGRQALGELGGPQARELQAELDRVRRALAEHSSMLKLFSTAEDRLVNLQNNTRMLAQTIAQLQSDIATYVTLASEKLDLVAGQIQAIGAAADATLVMLELKQSLEAMTESINHTTRFVSETQAYFRANVDDMIQSLELYDEQTQHVLMGNLAMNQVYDEMQIAEALAVAMSTSLHDEP